MNKGILFSKPTSQLITMREFISSVLQVRRKLVEKDLTCLLQSTPEMVKVKSFLFLFFFFPFFLNFNVSFNFRLFKLLRAQNFQTLGDEKSPQVYSAAISNTQSKGGWSKRRFTRRRPTIFRSPLDGSYCKFSINGELKISNESPNIQSRKRTFLHKILCYAEGTLTTYVKYSLYFMAVWKRWNKYAAAIQNIN